MDQLDQSIQVFRRDGLVLLVEVVDVAVEDLDEEFHADGCVHAGIRDAEGALETFEHAFAIAVELQGVGQCGDGEVGGTVDLRSWSPRRCFLRRLLLLSGGVSGLGSPTIDGLPDTQHGTGLVSSAICCRVVLLS